MTTTTEAEDAVSELLSRVFGSAASVYTDAETRKTTAAVFCQRLPPELEAKRQSLRTGLRQIESCGLDVGPGRIRIQKIPRQDWAESWKRHFRPIEIGKALLIKPSWSKRRPLSDQAIVILDPGLSFGTGQHPTTEFCLRELVRHRIIPERGRGQRPRRRMAAGSKLIENSKAPIARRALWPRLRTQPRSFLDIGTGSGILAIAAAELGYSPVCAIDFDPEAVRVARANAHANRVSSEIRISRVDLTKLPRRSMRRFDVICANLISTLLIAERRTIAAMMKRGGWLVLAGILNPEFRQVQTAYESLGLRLVASKTEKEWRSGTFCRVHWRLK